MIDVGLGNSRHSFDIEVRQFSGPSQSACRPPVGHAGLSWARL